jgi:hypothetical protein
MNKSIIQMFAATPRIIMLLICVIILQEVRIYMKEQSNGISVLIFGAVAKIPKGFFLESKTGSEITLVGDGASHLLIGNQIDPKTMAYSKAHLVAEDNRCGINVVFSSIKFEHSVIETAILYNDKNYMYIVNDNDVKKVTNNIIESICDSQKESMKESK